MQRMTMNDAPRLAVNGRTAAIAVYPGAPSLYQSLSFSCFIFCSLCATVRMNERQALVTLRRASNFACVAEAAAASATATVAATAAAVTATVAAAASLPDRVHWTYMETGAHGARFN